MESAAFLSAGFAGVVLSVKLMQLAIANLPLGRANSPLGNHCIDLAIHHNARTQSPLSLCAKNSTSKTASRRLDERSEVHNTRILRETQGNSVKSMESNAESLESSLRGQHPKQSTPLYRHCEYSQNVKQSIKNANFVNDAEFFAKSAEYLKDSSDSIESNHKIDCHDSATQNLAMTTKGDSAESTKDSNIIDCHDSATQNLAMTKNDAFAESSEKIDCHESQSDSRNDGICAIPRKMSESRNDASTLTVFARKSARIDEAIHKRFYAIKRLYRLLRFRYAESRNDKHSGDSTDSSHYRKYLQNIGQFISAKSRPFSLQSFDILLMLVVVLWAYALYLSLKSGRADYCGSFDIMSGLSYLKATFKSVRGAFFTLFFVALALALCSARFRIIVLGGLLWIVVIIVFYTLTVSRCGATWYLMSGLFLSMLCVSSVFVAVILRRFKALKSIVALVILVAFLQPFEPYKERPRLAYTFFKSHAQSWIDLAINADRQGKKELTIYVPKDFPHYHWESWFFPAFSRTLKNYGLVRGEMEIEFKAME